ncbi:hypothetical protein AW27_004040 [Streptomyces sp. PCS3-D2]|uniref:hypothetical protein n=1 Tax=Streptomyces sp. PCS3-D2 TaxID=1460244 RepID=UPI0004532291|nr:hypothetical protein [Streptomyces sp. PCS3-D2]WKV70761.1 hypothetical protein AW27_004040 [Streptomyces sp. PCS3-D2]
MPTTDRPAPRIRPSAAVAAVCVTVLLSGGCAGHAAVPASAEAGTPGTSIEEIAKAIGCTAEVSVEAEELRQGGCETGQGAYRMATFAARDGARAWLDEARAYGGIYLVGDRWVVTTQSADALNALRERLGGSVETGTAHHAPASGSTGPSAPDAAPEGSAAPSAGMPSGAAHTGPSEHTGLSEHSGHSTPAAGG